MIDGRVLVVGVILLILVLLLLLLLVGTVLGLVCVLVIVLGRALDRFIVLASKLILVIVGLLVYFRPFSYACDCSFCCFMVVWFIWFYKLSTC